MQRLDAERLRQISCRLGDAVIDPDSGQKSWTRSAWLWVQ